MRRTSASLLILAVPTAAWLLAWCGPQAAAPVQAAQAKDRAELTTLFFGNTSCGGGNCHGSATPAPPLKEKLDGSSTAFARHHELHDWNQYDRHKIATRVLTEGRGKQIAERLGIKGAATDPKGQAQWRQCLTCHGVALQSEKQVDAESFGPAQRLENGVSCVVCHGPHPEWVNAHVKPVGNNWRTLTREEKQDKYGLNDLWDATRRAELCCSCHVGNAAQGKVVTHEMVAAGHPPLPGFEIVTFSDAMPRHWETLAEKVKRLPQLKETYAKVYHLGEDAEQPLRLLMTSAIVALRQSMEIVVEQAKPTRERDWPEFALYDCYACHHDLKADSWRLKRPLVGKPGRPQLRDWPTALLPLVASRNAPAEPRPDLAGLQAAFSKTPFGDPAEVLPRANALVAWSNTTLDRLRATRFERGEASKLLHTLVSAAAKDLLDFDSARQVGWAVQVLLADARPARDKEPLDRLRQQLALCLPKGPQSIVGAQLHNVMMRRADYDAFAFQRNLRALALAQALPKP